MAFADESSRPNLSPSPKREHFKIPILINCLEQSFSYRFVETSRFCRLFQSHPHLLPTRLFRPSSARFGVGRPLCRPLLGWLGISIPVSVCSMYDIFVDNGRFPISLVS